MPVSARGVDRLVSIALYAGFGILTLWTGVSLVNFSLETKLHKDFLMRWEVALQRFSKEGGQWPQFSGANHVTYMDHLMQFMGNKGTPPPLSNTPRAYVYRLKRLGRPEERIFLLCFSNRMILYGISEKTFMKMDQWMDGKAAEEQGRFRGKRSRDGVSYVGVLQL
jgi:hypothetical protein